MEPITSINFSRKPATVRTLRKEEGRGAPVPFRVVKVLQLTSAEFEHFMFHLEDIEIGRRPAVIYRPPYQPYKKHPKYTGLLALYVHYLYLLGKMEQRRYPPRMTPQLRQEVMRFERFREQFAFLRDNNLTASSDMADFQARTEETLVALTKQRTILNVQKKKRKKLYDALADVEALAPAGQLYQDGVSGMEPEFTCYMEAVAALEGCGISREQLTAEKAEVYQKLAKLNRQIRAERKKLALCREIHSHLPQMEQEIQTIERKDEVIHNEHRRR